MATLPFLQADIKAGSLFLLTLVTRMALVDVESMLEMTSLAFSAVPISQALSKACDNSGNAK